MMFREWLVYILIAIIVDVLLTLTVPGIPFPFIRYILPLFLGYLFEEKEEDRKKARTIVPVILIAVMLLLMLYGPLNHIFVLFLESEYFSYMKQGLLDIATYIMDISVAFIIGVAARRIILMVKRRPSTKSAL